MILNTEVAGTESNSYVTLEECNDYVSVFGATPAIREAWLALDPEDQTRLLIQAANQNDMNFDWLGVKSEPNQALEWPRIIDNEDYGIPKAVKSAQCEQALWLVDSQPPASEEAPLSAVAVGPIKVSFNEHASFRQTLYMADKVKRLLANLGSIITPESAGSIKIARLIRS